MSFQSVQKEIQAAERRGFLTIVKGDTQGAKSLTAVFPQDVTPKAVEEIRERILKLEPNSIVRVSVFEPSVTLMIRVSMRTKKSRSRLKKARSVFMSFCRFVHRVIDPDA